jgi:UDP-N-acetylmuramate dehydrogenase
MENRREDTEGDFVNRIIGEFERIGCEYRRNFPMSRYTSMRVGGITNLIVYPKNHLELIKVLDLLSSLDFHWMVLGGGSNTIVSDVGIKGAVVSTEKMRGIEILEDGKIFAEAGAVMGTVLNVSLRAGLSGFEFAAGIPGTVGGGVTMNAGANDGEIKNVVESVWIWLNGRETVLSKDEIKFVYRKSHLPQGSVITRAMFSLRAGNGKESERMVKEYLDKRSKTQPIKTSNCGSIFKNPPEIHAGRLLDELGFKGFQVGRARFSEVHANFIVNSGGAKAADVLRLIEIAKEEAFFKRGVLLETEVRIVGEEM